MIKENNMEVTYVELLEEALIYPAAFVWVVLSIVLFSWCVCWLYSFVENFFGEIKKTVDSF